MFQYDSKSNTQPDKTKATTAAANKTSVQAVTKMPVQTKSLFSFSHNLENSGKQNEEQKQLESASPKPNNTGIPLQMKNKFENLSGFSFDDVKIHYNSDKPAQLQALAYTQGNQVYVGSGQEKHLGHELGHIVQQKQGRVKPTMHLQDMYVNDDIALEEEADYIRNKSEMPVIQMKSKVINNSQDYDFGADKVEVGESMEAWLDPSDPLTGQSANLNKSQDDMMTAIRSKYGITGGDVVKGHLLNDNVGGTALNRNLYPITGTANKTHLNYVENAVKQRAWNKRLGIYYSVEVDAIPDIRQAKADFDCEIKEWDPVTDKIGNDVIVPATITSDLTKVSSSDAFATYTGFGINPAKRPKKPAWVKTPKTRVSELSKMEKEEREDDG